MVVYMLGPLSGGLLAGLFTRYVALNMHIPVQTRLDKFGDRRDTRHVSVNYNPDEDEE